MTTAWVKSPPKVWSFFDYLTFFLGLCLIIGGLFCWQFYSSYRAFSRQTGLSFTDLAALYRDSQAQTLDQSDGHINFLLLGTDELAGRDQSFPLTDTIILASLQLDTNQIRLLPLPRDLYLPQYNSKINALYPNYLTGTQSIDSNVWQNPLELTVATQAQAHALARTRAAISGTFALPIHYSLVVTMNDLADFLTLIDGVDVTIPTSFTDYQYPRHGVDVATVSDPELLYETISFTAGPTHLDPESALKFIRSRHASGVEGNDYARSARQQLVLTAAAQKIGTTLLAQLQNYDFSFLAQLYQFYDQRFAAQLPFITLLAHARHFVAVGQLPVITSEQLAVSPGEDGANLREVETRDAWSLQITNQSGLLQEIKTKLNLSSS